MSYLLKKEERTDYEYRKARAYVSSNLIGIADDWYMEKELYKRKFKSKAWKGVSRLVNKKVNAAIVEHVEGVTGSSFSSKAGCACGCSPGYILEGPTYRSFDLIIEFGDEDLVELELYLDKADDILKDEKLAHEEFTDSMAVC